jgi:two-component system response regulator
MNSRRILLVEDDPLGVELALAALAECSLADAVDVVNDGVEALAYLDRQGAFSDRQDVDPRVVFLDLKMPRMDGLEVLARMRSSERLRVLPVVILSSSREDSDKQRSYDLGANAYVVKPLDFEQFKSTVKRFATPCTAGACVRSRTRWLCRCGSRACRASTSK